MWSTVFLILEFAMTENTQSTEIAGDERFPAEELETVSLSTVLSGEMFGDSSGNTKVP